MTTEPPKPVALKDHLHWMFPTPVIAYQWEDYLELNTALEKLILEREKASDSVQFSNSGGWQSNNDLLTWGAPSTLELKKRIDLLLFSVLKEMSANTNDMPRTRFRIDCWANVNRDGDYNAVHNHPNSLWSGVYYISKGSPNLDTPQSGILELMDPRDGANFIQVNRTITDTKCFMKNDPGLMLLFPSWLKHMVHPHKGDGKRISIAFNALPVT